jgi:hypothetical protein
MGCSLCSSITLPGFDDECLGADASTLDGDLGAPGGRAARGDMKRAHGMAASPHPPLPTPQIFPHSLIVSTHNATQSFRYVSLSTPQTGV